MTMGVETFEPDASKWDAWSPEEVARLLSGIEAPWYVAGGWAIDLFLRGQRRPHADLEIAVPNDRFREVAKALASFELFVISGRDEARALENASDELDRTHQTWAGSPRRAAGGWMSSANRRRMTPGSSVATVGSGFR
jgi:hypothetical protein